jgi:hypothetical protein
MSFTPIGSKFLPLKEGQSYEYECSSFRNQWELPRIETFTVVKVTAKSYRVLFSATSEAVTVLIRLAETGIPEPVTEVRKKQVLDLHRSVFLRRKLSSSATWESMPLESLERFGKLLNEVMDNVKVK